ncbi:nitrogen fixation protein NifW [Rhodoblastus sphagnicola]|uniref:Nitrogenase-stabilizing/protective protein NifW n=1 Tax=Rhodoblastus sphagnicola TaxID=333368 RepID=A0A2S6NE13_9HYPH|nr:nitrogenase stabilizing/protective protein NifW [Rhodoblastus sphagnicola]MBB4198426.1 nitrogenase-stabilizing/protective protein [Rhodoblastus sphagnicola]PPQ32846.1 nitrogen fixation protein NifW [Rhodoblastus sphagnicola]
MSALDDLNRLSSAEDFFTFLGVDFDPAVVRVSRLHIMRRMGQYLRGLELDGAFEGKGDDEIKVLCAEHLALAYQDFVESTPIEQRLFKVHKDAVAPKTDEPKPDNAFVPLSSLTVV